MRPSPLRLTAAAGATAAVLAVAPSARAADAVYGGSDNSGNPVVVKADPTGKELRSIVVSWRAACGEGQGGFPNADELTPVEPTPGFSPGSDELLVSRNAKGRFTGTQLAGASSATAVAAIAVEIDGKLAPKRASGTLSAIVKVQDKATGADITSCQTGPLRWVAARAPGVIYGGTTSQGEPFVARLNKQRNKVNDVLTTWRAPCTPDGMFRVPDRFTNFAVKRTGSFGNPFTYDTDGEAGARLHFDYRLVGRVSRTAAKGTLQVKVSETDANGAATTSCDSGGLTWKAATG